MPRERTYQIGDVAETVGLSLRTIRYYEEVGVVRPWGRTEGGFRLYTDNDIARLRLVKQMKPLEFTLDEMRDLLDTLDRLATAAEDHPSRVPLLERLAMYVAIGDQRCERLRDQLDAGERFLESLRAATSPSGDRSRRHRRS